MYTYYCADKVRITQAVSPVISIQPDVKFPHRRTYGGLGISWR